MKIEQIITQKEAAVEALMKMEGVTGVDVGYKYKDGKRTDEITIRVHVAKKKKGMAAKDMIPAEINGVKTDVIEMNAELFTVSKQVVDADSQIDATKYTTLLGGVSIGPERVIGGYVFTGTLGAIVKDNVTNNPMLLSNFHVMCVDSGWHAGDQMDQPSRVDGGVAVTDRVGVLHRAVLSSRVDGAISTLSGRPYKCEIQGIGKVKGTAGAVLGSAVRKRGRTTEFTEGFVDAISVTVNIDYGPTIGVKTLSNQIGIRPNTPTYAHFSKKGDSGSVVVDANNKVIGLLFAGNSSTGYTFINPISDVLSELNVSMCVAPTKNFLKEKIEMKESKVEFKESKKEFFKELRKENVKELIKDGKNEFEKTFKEGKPITDKLDKPFDGGGIRFPGGVGGGLIPKNESSNASLEERLAAMEATLSQLTAFISPEMRPDLASGALTNEADMDQMNEYYQEMQKNIADAAQY